MNVLHLQTRLDYTCGVTNHIFLIAKNVNKGIKHFVLSFGGDSEVRFNKANISLITLTKPSSTLFSIINAYNEILKLCKIYQIDIIHSHHRFFDLVASLLSKKAGVRTVMTVHSKLNNYKYFSYKAENLIAVSKAIKHNLLQNYKLSENKISVIQNFIDEDEAAIKVDKNSIINKNKLEGKWNIGFIGRFSIEEKGIDILLNSFQILSKKIKNVNLIFIGDGKDKNLIEKYQNTNKLSIRILPPQKDIFNFINICDIIILPSRTDSFPYIMLEAGLMKKAFIGAKVDGIAEYIDDGVDGILFEPGNEKQLAEKMELLISNKKFRIQIGETLYKKVMKNNSKEKLIKVYTDFYNNIIEHNSK